MLSKDRREIILERLSSAGNVQVAELANELNVSKMTIQRDLIRLEELGSLKRIHGGAIPQAKTASGIGTTKPAPTSKNGECLICTRPPTQHLLYTLTTTNGEQHQACCPHCGISAHLLYGDQILMALTADYLTGKLHAAQNSIFLMGSASAPCCHPSILTFEDEQMALRFQAGFGGTIGRLNDAISYLREQMVLDPEKNGCPHCAEAKAAREIN